MLSPDTIDNIANTFTIVQNYISFEFPLPNHPFSDTLAASTRLVDFIDRSMYIMFVSWNSSSNDATKPPNFLRHRVGMFLLVINICFACSSLYHLAIDEFFFCGPFAKLALFYSISRLCACSIIVGGGALVFVMISLYLLVFNVSLAFVVAVDYCSLSCSGILERRHKLESASRAAFQRIARRYDSSSSISNSFRVFVFFYELCVR